MPGLDALTQSWACHHTRTPHTPHLLQHATAALARLRPHHVDGGLALCAPLLIQGDVHLDVTWAMWVGNECTGNVGGGRMGGGCTHKGRGAGDRWSASCREGRWLRRK